MKTIDRLLDAQAQRQAAIDYLHKHPGAMAPEICEHFGWKSATGASRLQKMERAGELRRKDAVYLQKTVNGIRRQDTYKYWALVTQTKQAVDVVKAMGKNLTAEYRASEEAKARKKNPKPWITVNNPEDHPPLKNQGGQGGINAPRTATYLETMA